MLTIWFLLILGSNTIANIFMLKDEVKELVILFCLWVVPFFSFWGLIFVANAAFNNLGKPHYSTLANWSRATIDTLPFIYFGSLWFGAKGILTGYNIGSMGLGIAALYVCSRLIDQIKSQEANAHTPL